MQITSGGQVQVVMLPHVPLSQHICQNCCCICWGTSASQMLACRRTGRMYRRR